jgi:sterol desaturase/sphingolipid hydroxylase (fatty acid hydroxylase superfamily)
MKKAADEARRRLSLPASQGEAGGDPGAHKKSDFVIVLLAPTHYTDSMTMGILKAGATEAEDGFRTAKGEWRPPYPVKYVALFNWPPRLRDALKYILSYPGFLWPWNSVYLLITLGMWFYITPALSHCAAFRARWISQVFLGNLALLWLWTGGWHLLLYTFKAQGTKRKYNPRWLRVGDPKFLFHNQLYDNIFWSCVSGCTVWSAYEVLYLWAAANHHVPYLSWSAHPVYFAVWLCAIPFWREFHFYWSHRATHWKPLYKYVHYLHHKNVNPGPWSGLAMHPVEHIIYFSMVLIHFVVPSHPIHFLLNAQLTALEPAPGHHGFEGPLLDGKLPTGSYFHYLHHRYFECNYGGIKLPLDRFFGTFRDGLSDVVDANPPEPQVGELAVLNPSA